MIITSNGTYDLTSHNSRHTTNIAAASGSFSSATLTLGYYNFEGDFAPYAGGAYTSAFQKQIVHGAYNPLVCKITGATSGTRIILDVVGA